MIHTVRGAGYVLKPVGLLAVVCLALGVASTYALQSFLVDRLDGQLQAAGGRSAGAVGPGARGRTATGGAARASCWPRASRPARSAPG